VTQGTRPRPKLFRALGAHEPPAAVEVEGRAFALGSCLKHDSWAATAVYRCGERRILCKFGRQQPILGVPARWLGRALARREGWFLENLGDLPSVPRSCGPVRVAGAVVDHAVAHDYIGGHPLSRDERVDDRFFPRLHHLLDAMHGRGVAYVDLHKRENIVVGDDGRPWLVDYQICWRSTAGRWGRLWPARRVFASLCVADRYHLIKHQLRLRPDQVPGELRDLDRLRPSLLHWHRLLVGDPFRALRRRILVWMAIRSGAGRAKSEVFPEESVRLARERRASLGWRGGGSGGPV